MREMQISVPWTPIGGWQVWEERPQVTPWPLFKAEPCWHTLVAHQTKALSKQMLSRFNLWKGNVIWKNKVLSALQYFYTVVGLRVLQKALWDHKSSHVVSYSFASAHKRDNAFPGPGVQVVSSASNDLEALLSWEPRGRLLGGRRLPFCCSCWSSWDGGSSFCLVKTNVQL